MTDVIENNIQSIIALCQQFSVERLEIFGSACTSDFGPDRSDIDFLVRYPRDHDLGPWLGRHFEFEQALSELLNRPVDVIMPKALENPWFQKEAEKTRRVIYDASEIAKVA